MMRQIPAVSCSYESKATASGVVTLTGDVCPGDTVYEKFLDDITKN